MGFIQRIFTPPGTGGREAQALIAQHDAAQAASKQTVAAAAPPPQAPNMPEAGAAPKAPPQFAAGAAPGAKQRAQITASTMLGAAAAGGQTAKKSLLGQ